MDYIERIKPYHLDVLREIGNIGAGNAATALSTLLNKSIDMKVPSVRVVSFQEIADLVGGEDNVVAAIFLRLEGDAPGSMFLLIPVAEAEQLIQRLIGNSTFQLSEPPFEELGLSALQELGNILAGSYLSALSDFTKLNLQPSVPAISIDLAGAILSFGLIELSQVSDYAIVIDTEVQEMDNEFSQSSGHFFLLPDPNAFEKIFKSLGVEMDE
ncbi:chemotaxis protein CheC [Alkalihalobacterium sp. APHAB7]|uniref:chemotaxis protein CheC n=1 Tax=Alkalihalobacterium sp. APHAB7 TaxID=3402081 RepID=UPI003AABA816